MANPIVLMIDELSLGLVLCLFSSFLKP
jgi:hypothetical protein